MIMHMRRWLSALAVMMTVLFVLMSWCLILQAAAVEKNVPLCHASGTTNHSGSGKTAAMERCCQPGVLKSSKAFTVNLQPVDFLPASGYTEQPSLDFHRTQQDPSPFLSPPTAQRLAELSLLRI